MKLSEDKLYEIDSWVKRMFEKERIRLIECLEAEKKLLKKHPDKEFASKRNNNIFYQIRALKRYKLK